MNAVLRGFYATLVGSVALFSAHSAFAADACFNDDDCPGGGKVCGGDVCDWGKPFAMPPDAMKIYTCVPAGTAAKGMDGWCTTDANCKCMAEGANCKTPPHCSFTKPSDAPAGTGGSGTGGSSAGGSAGTTSTAGTTSAAGTGTTMPEEKSGGCSVGVPGNSAGGSLVAACLVGLGIAFSRRRRAA